MKCNPPYNNFRGVQSDSILAETALRDNELPNMAYTYHLMEQRAGCILIAPKDRSALDCLIEDDYFKRGYAKCYHVLFCTMQLA